MDYTAGGSGAIDGAGAVSYKTGIRTGESEPTVVIAYEVPTVRKPDWPHGAYIHWLTEEMGAESAVPPERLPMPQVTTGDSISEMSEGIKATLRARPNVQAFVIVDEPTSPRLTGKSSRDVTTFFTSVRDEVEQWAAVNGRVVELFATVNPQGPGKGLGWVDKPGSLATSADRLRTLADTAGIAVIEGLA